MLTGVHSDEALEAEQGASRHRFAFKLTFTLRLLRLLFGIHIIYLNINSVLYAL